MATRKRKAKNAALAKSNKDKWEVPFLNHWKLLHGDLPAPLRDYKHIPGRKFALDFAWPDLRIGCELHGGGNRSRHNTVKGMAADLEKHNLGIVYGWRVLAYNVVAMRDMAGVVDEVAELVKTARGPAAGEG
jgi:hypothetical protein